MLLTATCCIGPCLRAQTPVTLQDYRRQVLEYSYRLKQAAENAEAAYQSARGLHTGFLPQLSADGDFSIHFKNRYGTQDGQEKLLRPYSFSLQPAVVQQIYGGEAFVTVTGRHWSDTIWRPSNSSSRNWT